MAKSLRSKWKRKMRAVKRERYGQKELERLKKTVGEDGVKKEIDVVMTDISEVVTVTDAKNITNKSKPKKDVIEIKDEEKMDDDKIVHKYSSKTMKDQFGSYPVWMNQRKISKHKKARKGRPKRNFK